MQAGEDSARAFGSLVMKFITPPGAVAPWMPAEGPLSTSARSTLWESGCWMMENPLRNCGMPKPRRREPPLPAPAASAGFTSLTHPLSSSKSNSMKSLKNPLGSLRAPAAPSFRSAPGRPA